MKKQNKSVELLKVIEDILVNEPKGLRFKEIEKIIKEKYLNLLPTFSNIAYIVKQSSSQIYHIKGGSYIHKKYFSNIEDDFLPYEEEKKGKSKKSRENNEGIFYKAAAEFLIMEDECSKAEPFGGKLSNKKWGTPDVLGIFKPKQVLGYQYPYEIITAEIKSNTEETITAFGQAIAYRLFSHKVFLVLPDDIKDIDKKRIKSLCILFGLGLVLFDKKKKTIKPKMFELIVRAQKNEPDIFYVCEFIETLRESKKTIFDELFN